MRGGDEIGKEVKGESATITRNRKMVLLTFSTRQIAIHFPLFLSYLTPSSPSAGPEEEKANGKDESEIQNTREMAQEDEEGENDDDAFLVRGET